MLGQARRGAAHELQQRVAAKAEERRWLILIVLCFSLLVIVLDNSILNVAMPTIVRELHATNSQLQWMVDSYTLVFAGLLLTAGSLGDRFGRLPALQLGFAVFGIGSLASALAGDANTLIATRAFMGIGGAFIMPATLSIITNVFPARERGKAIGVWAATAGVAVALGPLTGGFLLEHFYWGSIFLVNLPIVAVGIAAGIFLIPNSKDPAERRLDPIGAVLSIAGLSALLYAIIEAPTKGWTADSTLIFFVLGGALLAAFFTWEVRSDHPMLDLTFFKNPRFSIASGAIMVTFFSMFGALFVLTQYLQFVLGYSPLKTGVRLLAFAIPMMIVSPLSAKFVEAGRGEDGARGGSHAECNGGAAVPWRDPVVELRRHRVAHGDHGDRHGADDGTGHRFDHGFAAARPRRRGVGGERHHAADGWRDRRGRGRQCLRVGLRIRGRRCLPSARSPGGRARDRKAIDRRCTGDRRQGARACRCCSRRVHGRVPLGAVRGGGPLARRRGCRRAVAAGARPS